MQILLYTTCLSAQYMVKLYVNTAGGLDMRIFDYSFLNNGLLPANLVNLTASIASLKTMAGVRKGEYAQVFTELGYEYGGQYKTDDNVILEVDSKGQRRVRFRPTSAVETPQAMEQLELAYLAAKSDANINQLLLIPCVILDFLCIHPFRDGNGRMSRLLSLLLLYKNGYDAGKYVSFEEQINHYKAYYYEALRQSSNGWESNENSYFPFIENFLSTLYMCYKELDKRFAVVHGRKVTKKARVEATVLNSLTPISKAEICQILPDVSPTTVEAVLGAMVKSGSVIRIGQARNTRYIKA